ncbi:MAG: peptide chain release factor 2 [Parcubacteria group bacterium Gr01-1014_18]|nr:MAG: peptide chain release factor 2 [Parcubacteria group bacterium Greene0416_36]TSC81297.1 MAG: peptide chain release factor 2 [Parcubacteria group bacterium Gr01-1014_18]TSC99319.1 MAG: peptide chain release factor 2 [Parcubacteria group bacterium Greene1014_20]TSD06844.1 MAG: peptide chain release factor 2 [Parcubacteria group bacterium Greene0714_2]
MAEAGFWQRPGAEKKAREFGAWKEEVEGWKKLRSTILALTSLLEEAQVANDLELLSSIMAEYREAEASFSKMEFGVFLGGPYDDLGALLSIHGGTGGVDAQDWAQMLMRMIIRFCEKKKWNVTILSLSAGGEAGIKSVDIRIEGRFVYGHLKSEAGLHRLVRISPFGSADTRQTSFSLIEVIPLFDDISEIEIRPEDLRVDTFLAGGHGGQGVQTTYSAVRVVHLPTGITVACQNERSQIQNRETAISVLKNRLYQKALEEKESKEKKLRGQHKESQWGSQIRSYVLHPYKLVKDHRSGHESTDPESILDGELDLFMLAYLRWAKGLEVQDKKPSN